MKPMAEQKMRSLADCCLPGSSLDLGCSKYPNRFLSDAVGLDIEQPDDRPKNYRDLVLCDLNWEDMPFEDGSFENVVAGDFMEHVENPSHVLRESNRVLKKDGRMIICTPQANDWWVTLHNWFFRSWIKDPDPGEHLHNWTMLDMTRLLKKNGFVVDRIEGLFLHLPGLYLKISKLSWRPRLRRFPQCAWQVIYVARKVSPVDKPVRMKRNSGQAEMAQAFN